MAIQDEINIEDQTGYIYINVYGAYSLEKILRAIEAGDKKFHEKLYSGILYDFRSMYGKSGTIDRIRIGKNAARYRNRGAKIALLFQLEHVHNLKFLETYLQNRGVQFRLFANQNQAVEWFFT